MSEENKIEILEAKIDQLTKIIEQMNKRIPKRVEVATKMTQSNIQLAGSAVSTKNGVILATLPGQKPDGSISLMFVVSCEDGTIVVANEMTCRPIEE